MNVRQTKENAGHEDVYINGFLRQAEVGMPIMELCCKNGFSKATFYEWRSKFGSTEVVAKGTGERERHAENASG